MVKISKSNEKTVMWIKKKKTRRKLVKMVQKQNNSFWWNIVPIVGPIISRTKCDRHRPTNQYFLQKEQVNKIELGVKCGHKEIWKYQWHGIFLPPSNMGVASPFCLALASHYCLPHCHLVLFGTVSMHIAFVFLDIVWFQRTFFC